MKLLSVNVGQPREVEWRGELLHTAIFKSPVEGSVRAGRLNLEGDRQADLSVHGGMAKAVYAYPSEHYPFWRATLRRAELPWGAFGENLTTEGVVEGDVRIGDRLRIGDAEFVVTQPRMPCLKLVMRFDRPDMAKRFMESGRSGFYLSVVREGVIRAGDAIERVGSDEGAPTITEVLAEYRKHE